MKAAADGSTVTINYIGTLDNGHIFHSTDAEGALTVTIGNNELFPALEQAIIGMKCGESKNIVLKAEEAYGHRQPENIITVAKRIFPAEREISVGQKLSIEFRGGESRSMIVRAVSESEVVLDGNHPLAGCELTFALRVDAVQ